MLFFLSFFSIAIGHPYHDTEAFSRLIFIVLRMFYFVDRETPSYLSLNSSCFVSPTTGFSCCRFACRDRSKSHHINHLTQGSVGQGSEHVKSHFSSHRNLLAKDQGMLNHATLIIWQEFLVQGSNHVTPYHINHLTEESPWSCIFLSVFVVVGA